MSSVTVWLSWRFRSSDDATLASGSGLSLDYLSQRDGLPCFGGHGFDVPQVDLPHADPGTNSSLKLDSRRVNIAFHLSV